MVRWHSEHYWLVVWLVVNNYGLWMGLLMILVNCYRLSWVYPWLSGWWWLEHDYGFYFSHHIGNGISSSQHFRSPSFFRGVGRYTTNQSQCHTVPRSPLVPCYPAYPGLSRPGKQQKTMDRSTIFHGKIQDFDAIYTIANCLFTRG